MAVGSAGWGGSLTADWEGDPPGNPQRITWKGRTDTMLSMNMKMVPRIVLWSHGKILAVCAELTVSLNLVSLNMFKCFLAFKKKIIIICSACRCVTWTMWTESHWPIQNRTDLQTQGWSMPWDPGVGYQNPAGKIPHREFRCDENSRKVGN